MEAVHDAIKFVSDGLAKSYSMGSGHGPVNHFHGIGSVAKRFFFIFSLNEFFIII